MNVKVEKRADVHIRWMIRRDMPYVFEIEKDSFDAPWSEVDFIKRLSRTEVIAMVADLDDDIAGFVVYSLNGPTLTLERFAVHPKYRRSGIGTRLAKKIESKLSYHRPRAIIDVREGNLAGQMFFSRMGWQCTEINAGPWEDLEKAYRFELRRKQ